MKKSILLLTILLISCSPQVTVTSEVTVTFLPASPTLEATSTPKPIITPTAKAVSDAMIQANELVETYELDGKVTVTQQGNLAVVTDIETGKVLMQSNGVKTWYGLEFAVDTIAAQSCDPTEFKPNKDGLMLADYADSSYEYFDSMRQELGSKPIDGAKIHRVLIDRDKQCWGFIENDTLFLRDENKVPHKFKLIAIAVDQLLDFLSSR